MLTEDKITEIFVMADECCKVFNAMLRRRGLSEPRKDRKREYHRDSRLSQAEIIVIMIMFHKPQVPKALLSARNMPPVQAPVSQNRFVQSIHWTGKVCGRAVCGIRKEMSAWQMYRNQLRGQHLAAGMPQPAYPYAQGFQGSGTAWQMLFRLVLRL